jgi:2-dehydropantoate 2-reductase
MQSPRQQFMTTKSPKAQPPTIQQRILVIGSGGIAGLYGGLLHKAGWQVDMVARSDHEVVRERGLKVDSVLGDLSFKPEKVYADIREAGTADWLMLAVKMLPEIDLAALIKPVVGPQTRILLIANGLDVEAPLANAFPDNNLISGVAFVCSSRTAPGHIKHTSAGRLLVGNYPSGTNTHCQLLADAFSGAGIKAGTSTNIPADRWKKSIWNASFNPLSVLANGADTDRLLGTPQAEALVRAIMTEVIQVANAEGHDLPDSLIEANLASTRAMPPYLTSMAQDYVNGHPIELDAIVGRLIGYANKHGLAIPHLRTVYEILRIRMGSESESSF